MNVSEHETTSQNLLKEKLTEYTAITPLCRSSLLVELMNEMTELKEELDDRLGTVLFLDLYFTVLDFRVTSTKKSIPLILIFIKTYFTIILS